MSSPVTGLHHVTAICSDPQANLDFYAKTLGQRFVKKTVNFDDPSAYHLYYGDQVGSAGTIMTFFAWARACPGARGAGQVTITHYAAPVGSLGFWTERVAAGGGAVLVPSEESFGQRRAIVRDPDGLLIALVETDDARAPWLGADGVSDDTATRGFHGATIALQSEGATLRALTEVLGYEKTDEAPLGPGAGRGEGKQIRLRNARGAAANIIDLHVDPGLSRGGDGAGAVHHVAFSVPDRAAQDDVRRALLNTGLQVTPQIDRDYFYAIYARTPEGLLIEVATEEPGFTADEPVDQLGAKLKLPKQHEAKRTAIEQILPALQS